MTTDELLARMRTVMNDPSRKRWVARAMGSNLFGHGKTPREAMEDALRLLDDEL